MLRKWWTGGRWRYGRPAIAVAVVIAIIGAGTGAVLLTRRAAENDARAAALAQSLAASPSAEPSPSPTPEPTPTPSPSATPTPTPAPASKPATPAPANPGGAPSHFATLPPGSALPSGAQCASWVKAQPLRENKGVNASFNQATGHHLGSGFFPTSDDARANTQIGVRVDGSFTGTTQEILRWAACKWGIDEDIVYAQAAKESWWQQTTKGDFGTDASACPPGHGLGVDGTAGQCPQSYGILQNRYPYEQTSWPGISNSTAMNADTAYAIWRTCFEGYEGWLNTVDRGSQYGAGDAWGCVGRWFAGRWHTSDANQYMAAVQSYESQRIWTQSNFQEP